jgi:hypothetical protein
MERFALKTNMYLACDHGPFLRQRVAEAEGLIASLLRLVGLDLATPDQASASHRATRLWARSAFSNAPATPPLAQIMSPRRPALCRGQGRADPHQQPRRWRGRNGREARRPPKPGAKKPSPAGRGVQCDGAGCRCTGTFVIRQGAEPIRSTPLTTSAKSVPVRLSAVPRRDTPSMARA